MLVKIYHDANGREPLTDWLERLDEPAQLRIAKRIR